jgi:hypothetical protein
MEKDFLTMVKSAKKLRGVAGINSQLAESLPVQTVILYTDHRA